MNGPWKITSDSLTYHKNLLVLEGNCEVSNGAERLMADRIAINETTKELEANGNVKFETQEGTLSGEMVELNIEKGTGRIQGGKLFFIEDNIHLSGDIIEKTGEDTYRITSGSVTTCDGEVPVWRLGAKEIDVTLGSYARAKHATFHVKSIPLMYAPYLMFPTGSAKRETGFLMPRYHQSQRDGLGLDVPFFWAISDNMDATLYQHYMRNRGYMQGIEYRYVLDRQSKGTIRFDYLKDKGGQSDFERDNIIRTNKDRWWVRGKVDQALPRDVAFKLDLDVISDEDYLREFRRGYSGFNASHEAFLEEFRRGLDEETSLLRRSTLGLNKNWETLNLYGVCRYNQNLDKSDDKDKLTLHQLPSINLVRTRQSIFNSPLLAELNSSYTNYWRSSNTTGHRFDIHPRMNLPFKFKNYLNSVYSIGFKETAYIVNRAGSDETLRRRELFDLRGEFSTEFSRAFNLKSGKAPKIRHAIQPKIVYEYIPYKKDRGNLPYFDGEDFLDSRNTIHYSLTNYLIGKIIGEGGDSHYKELLRLALTQSYDFDATSRPFSDIVGELELTPLDYMVIDLDSSWSPYDSKFTSYNVRSRFFDRRGDSLRLDYRYKNYRREDVDNIRQFNTDLEVRLSDVLSISGGYRHSFISRTNVESRLGLNYRSQCWGIGFTYIDEYHDQRFVLTFSLPGIGEFKF